MQSAIALSEEETLQTAKAVASQYLQVNKNWKSEDYFLETVKHEGTNESPIIVVDGIHTQDTHLLQRGGGESVQLWVDVKQCKVIRELAYQ